MNSKIVLFSSVLWNTSLTNCFHDDTWNMYKISPDKKPKIKRTRKKCKDQKSKFNKGRITKNNLIKTQTLTKIVSEPLITSTPIKDNFYKVDKIRDTSYECLELSPIKEIVYKREDSYNILDDTTTSDHPSMNPFYCSDLIEPGTNLIYEYENDYQYIYKVIDNNKLEFLKKRYYPYVGCSTIEEKKKLKARLEEERNKVISPLQDISRENIKSALRKEDAPKKSSNVQFRTFISRQKIF